MTVTYDANNKKWTITERAKQGLKQVNYPSTSYYLNVYMTRNVVTGANISTEKDPKATKSGPVTGPLEANLWDRVGGDVQNVAFRGANYNGYIYQAMQKYIRESANVKSKYEEAQNNDSINKNVIIPYNNEVDTYNSKLPTVKAVIGSTAGGDYVQQRDSLKKLGIAGLEDNFKTFYRAEKLQSWDTKLGAKPPYGEFDPKFYKEQNPNVAETWKKAVAEDDIDITERYGEEGFYLQHYTNQGKAAGLRGNPVEDKQAVNQYLEKKPTDKDLQDVRTLQLGVGDVGNQTDRLLKIPRIAEEWEKAKNGDTYWKELAKEKYLDLNKKDEFAALFRLSERPEDKQVSFDYNVNQGYGITELEDAINKAAGEKATVDVKRFGALTQSVLKDTIEEIKKAKAKEQTLGMLNNLGTFGEIMGVNQTITDSLLGESGIGGYLSFVGGDKYSESLEKGLKNITGVGNNVTYNWQKWFDDTLTKKYQEDLELGYTTDEAKETIKIQKEFATNFIEKYLKPRFDESRSMDEFVEYLDVRQSEKNPFQTEDLVTALNNVANVRSQYFLDQLKQASDRTFDPSFYFNPTGDDARKEDYAKQSQTVNADWEAAKQGDPYWAQQAYRFGVDINDKNAFAKLHYQVKGRFSDYDGAEDILNASKVSNYIYNTVLPSLEQEALKQGSVFGQFLKPKEFADELLKGVDFTNKEEWNKVLKATGLDDFKGTIDELKDTIMETLQTGSARQIRENIKYLNEKRKKPTQELLGSTYIERPEDFKNTQEKGTTELYKIFQQAGYQGSEDEFYEKYFPDVNREEQIALTKAGTTGKFELQSFDFSDPFAAMGTMEGFFGSEDSGTAPKSTTSTTSKTSSDTDFFKLGFEDDEDYKSARAESILGEFTSAFKGF
jgi:hypothetical protein